MTVKVIFILIITNPDAGIVHVGVVVIRPSASRAKELSRARAQEAFNRVLHSMRACVGKCRFGLMHFSKNLKIFALVATATDGWVTKYCLMDGLISNDAVSTRTTME